MDNKPKKPRKQNKEFNHGYVMGYEFAGYNGIRDPKAEILSRGISLRTQYDVGFRLGHKDRKYGLAQRYFDD